ncbi:extensin family protein [Primorskyibacter sp. S87]|uniref:extensin-like domain-containing protein n=1 Tax=Primorskyibacter sp. S87 TaxID=3415126 RepID=UPI003C7AD599
MKKLSAMLGLSMLLLPMGLSAAQAPDSSLRPMQRPQVRAATEKDLAALQAAAKDVIVGSVTTARLRPQARPVSEQIVQTAARPSGLPFFGPDVSLRPWARPPELEQQVLFKKRKRRKGSVCGNIDIQGENIGRVPGKIRGCGVSDAVRVTEVSGVKLSQGAVMTCDTARALNTWVSKGLKPAFRKRGPVVEMKVAAHYACRTRNNQRGARISEHGKGRAIDISSFKMMDGEVVTVLKGWGQGTTKAPLRQSWKTACGPFGTVLGPQADRYHRDHFHLDTASHRSGPYCR